MLLTLFVLCWNCFYPIFVWLKFSFIIIPKQEPQLLAIAKCHAISFEGYHARCILAPCIELVMYTTSFSLSLSLFPFFFFGEDTQNCSYMNKLPLCFIVILPFLSDFVLTIGIHLHLVLLLGVELRAFGNINRLIFGLTKEDQYLVSCKEKNQLHAWSCILLRGRQDLLL